MPITTNINVLKADGCQLAEPAIVFYGIHNATAGDPCKTGCAYFNDGKCPAYRKHHTDFKKPDGSPKAPEKTIKQWATELGISVSEVRRRKANNALGC